MSQVIWFRGTSRHVIRDTGLIATLCLALYLAGNGRVSLWDRDEAWYAQTAREMLQRGDYVVPTFNAQPRYRKPVLIYWLMAGSYTLFGENEFGARFVSALAGTLTCLLTYRLGLRMAGRSMGLAAASMLAIAPFMVIESKLATTDAVLTALFVGAISCLWELHTAGFSWPRSLGFWCFIGLMILTKGPFGPAFLALVMVLWLLLSRDWGLLRRLGWMPGAALAVLICLPWAVAIYQATNGEFYRVALGEQAMGHSFSAMNNHRGFPGYFLVLALCGMMPWTLLLPLALSGVRQWAREDSAGALLIAWLVGPMLMLEVMRTKLPQYYLPAFPALALLIGRGVARFHESGMRLVQSRGGLRRVLLQGSLGLGLAVGLGGVSLWWFPADLRFAAVTAASLLGAGIAAATVLMIRQRDRFGWCVSIATWWTFWLVIAGWLVPCAEICRIARASAIALRDQATPEAGPILFGYREPSLIFYMGRPIPSLSSIKELEEFLQHQGSATSLLRDSDLAKLRKSQEIMVQPCERIEGPAIRGLGRPSVLVARLSIERGMTR